MKKLTVNEVATIVAQYHTAFPDWRRIGIDLLARFSGPVAQVIWFDALRTGAYRPTCRVHILAAPSNEGGIVVLPQLLNVKIREIMPRMHEKSFAAVVAALKLEILPSVGKALNSRAVADLLEPKSVGRPVNAYALACLFGAMKLSGATIRWTEEYHHAIAGLGLPVQPVDIERSAFLDKIGEWIKMPDCDSRFAEIIEQQKARLLQS